MANKDSALPQIQVCKLQMRQLFDSQSAPQHHHNHGLVARLCDAIKKNTHFLISQVSGQAPWHQQGRSPFHRIGHFYFFLMIEVVIKDPDAGQMAINGLGI
jgi:hypothetical protein